MIVSAKVFLRKIRRYFSRSAWGIKLLGLSKLNKSADKPGLVMVQIDGLSFNQFQNAIQKGRMPFLNSLLQKDRYELHTLYSGLPSNTPNVQAEIFYGVKTCVPAFNFVDRKTGQSIKMFDTPYVAKLEEELKKKGAGLLTGGSSYSNIFTGGAEEAHCCFSKLGWGGVLHAVNPLIFPFLVILYIDIFLRTFFLLIIEVVIAAVECIRGTLKGRVFLKELEFVWLRALVCVSLREFIIAGASMDIMRGLPIIHLNLLGYDEQAHCRGPSSRFAHWSLQGIDDAIGRLAHMIKHSPFREYDLWIYSDHGQEKTTPFPIAHGCTLQEAVSKLFNVAKDTHVSSTDILKASVRTRLLNERMERPRHDHSTPETVQVSEVTATAMGPVGHIYVNRKLDPPQTAFYGQKLVHELKIPLVMTRHENNTVLAWTEQGSHVLPQDMNDVFGQDHPFIDEIRKDVMDVCFHPDAGDFVIWGWHQKTSWSASFSLEYGAHAGAGMEETRAFALLPMDVYHESPKKKYLRPIDLRKAAENFMMQKFFFRYLKPHADPKTKTLRIMSYNVHGCKGMDGKISTDRLARVITRYNPDVVALQELDAGRLRSSRIHQAEKIAHRLEMSFHFHPAHSVEDEHYGNAILSRFPMKIMKQDALPKLWNRKFLEPRGAIWAVIDYHGMKVNIVNTHLSVWHRERLVQMKALLNNDWLQHPDCQGPLVLCGDLNLDPKSPVYKEICTRLHDSQLMLSGHKPTQTWFTDYPFRRIDHIFVTPEFSVRSIEVSHTTLAKVASDHLPLIVELSLEKGI